MDKNNNIFVIMPFDEDGKKRYEKIYKPVIDELKLNPLTADSIQRPSLIIEDIWKYTNQAFLILADLTNLNPNVFYEIGLAHGIKKPIIFIIPIDTSMPFDIQGIRMIVYKPTAADWPDCLRDELRKSIINTRNNPEECIPSYLLTIKESKQVDVSKYERDIIELKQSNNLLKNKLNILESEIKNLSYFNFKTPSYRFKLGEIRPSTPIIVSSDLNSFEDEISRDAIQNIQFLNMENDYNDKK